MNQRYPWRLTDVDARGGLSRNFTEPRGASHAIIELPLPLATVCTALHGIAASDRPLRGAGCQRQLSTPSEPFPSAVYTSRLRAKWN